MGVFTFIFFRIFLFFFFRVFFSCVSAHRFPRQQTVASDFTSKQFAASSLMRPGRCTRMEITLSTAATLEPAPQRNSLPILVALNSIALLVHPVNGGTSTNTVMSVTCCVAVLPLSKSWMEAVTSTSPTATIFCPSIYQGCMSVITCVRERVNLNTQIVSPSTSKSLTVLTGDSNWFSLFVVF